MLTIIKQKGKGVGANDLSFISAAYFKTASPKELSALDQTCKSWEQLHHELTLNNHLLIQNQICAYFFILLNLMRLL